jgi:hypothetical protein
MGGMTRKGPVDLSGMNRRFLRAARRLLGADPK